LLLSLSFISADSYILEENFGDIKFNLASEEIGSLSQYISGAVEGEVAYYFFENATYDKDMFVSVTKFDHQITNQELVDLIQETSTSYEYLMASPPYEIGTKEGSQVAKLQTPNPNMISFLWMTSDSVVFLVLDDEREIMKGR